LELIYKEFLTQEIVAKLSRNMGLGSVIRDPGFGKKIILDPDLGVKKESHPESGPATLITGTNYIIKILVKTVVVRYWN
jgi:hypothetical protein